jgi:hypothetical protein
MRKVLLMMLMAMPLYGQMTKETNASGTYTYGFTNGDLKYNYIHAVGSADSVSVALTVSQNVDKKMVIPGFTWKEANGITCAADSVIIGVNTCITLIIVKRAKKQCTAC